LYSGQAASALTRLQHALDLDPTNPQVLLNKARAFRTMNRLADEESVYRELVRSRPNYWPAYDQLGLALYRRAQYAEAAQAFSEGAAVAPKVVRVLNNLGAMQLLMNQPGAAFDTFKRSVAAVPTATAYQNLGTLAFARHDTHNALTYYQRALQLAPKDEAIARNIGDIQMVIGNREQALQSYARGEQLIAASLETNPNRGDTWMLSAYYHAKLGHREPAVRALQQAEALGASSMQSQFKKVQTLALLGKTADALDLLVTLRQSGLSTQDVDLAIDLTELRKTPRYLATLNPTTNPESPPEVR
jgi:tetratricopeptide (TPR) repeat protein